MRCTKQVAGPAVCVAALGLLIGPAGAMTLTANASPGAWQTNPSARRPNRLEIRASRTSATEDLFHAAAGLDLQPTGELPAEMDFIPSLYLNETPAARPQRAPLVVIPPPAARDKTPAPAQSAESFPGGSLDLAIAGVALLASRRWRSPMAQ